MRSVPPEVLWSPPADARTTTRMGRWMDSLDRGFETYDDAWRWSISDLDGFWSSVWDHLGVHAHTAPTAVLADRSMPGAVWFPGATLNYAEHALTRAPAGPAVLSRSHTRGPVDLTGPE